VCLIRQSRARTRLQSSAGGRCATASDRLVPVARICGGAGAGCGGECMSKVVIIAAMERELAPLVRGWKRAILASDDKKLTLFESDSVLAVIAGIGCKNAEKAARAVVAQYR